MEQQTMAFRDEQATTEQDMQIAELMGKLGDAEQVLFCGILKGLAGGTELESMLIHQPDEYMQILAKTEYGKLVDARPLMRYIRAKWGNMGDEAFTMGMAYMAGIADGKRLDRARRAGK